MDFLQRPGRSLNPKLGRTADQRKGGKKGKKGGDDDSDDEEEESRSTLLCLILKLSGGDDDPARDIVEGAFIARKRRLATYVDFALFSKGFPPPIIITWNGKTCQPEGSAESTLADVSSFAKLNWPDAANEFGYRLSIVDCARKKVSAFSCRSTANQNIKSGFLSKGQGEGAALRMFRDCLQYRQERLRRLKAKAQGKSAGPRP